MSLLSQESVRKELNLTEDQAKSASELNQKRRDSFGSLRDLGRDEARAKMEERAKADEKVVADLLKPEQLKRLKQIVWQQRGPQALSEPEVATALGLTDEQKTKAKAIQEKSWADGRELFQGGGDRQGAWQKAEDLRKKAGEDLTALLTDEQKTKWKDLTGEPFKGELQRFRGGDGGGRRRRGGDTP